MKEVGCSSPQNVALRGDGLGLRQLSASAAATLARQVLSSLLGLATSAVIARAFGPSGNGALAIALLLPTALTTLLNLGLVSANVFFLGSSQVSIRQLLLSNLRVFCVISCAGLLGGGAILTGAASSVFPGVEAPVLWLALSMFPLSLLNSLLQSVFQGLQLFRAYNTIAISQSLLSCIFVAALAILDRSEIAFLVGIQVLVQFIVLVVSIALLRPTLSKSDDPDWKSSGFERRLLGYGWKAHASNVVAFFNYKADMFLANMFLGPGAVGIYAIAVALGERLWLIPQAVGTVLFPRLSQLAADPLSRTTLTPIVARSVFSLTLVVAGALAAVSKPATVLIFGEVYVAALVPLWIMMPGFVLAAISQVLANDIAARGRPELNMITSVVSLAVNICANLTLIPRLGLQGAALSTTISLAMNTFLKLVLYSRLSGNTWRECLLVQRVDFVRMKRAFASRIKSPAD